MGAEGGQAGGCGDEVVSFGVALDAVPLTVQLRRAGVVLYLDVRSPIDPSQTFLLSLGCEPLFAGIAWWTPLGRIHALYWGLVYGRGELPAGSVVRFDAFGPCAHAAAVVAPVPLGEGCWVATAEGVFTGAAVVSGSGDEVARTALSERW